MTEHEYRSAPGISRSQLWKLHDSSPEKFKWWLDHPEEPTPALIFGQLVHKLLLEPDGFEDEFMVFDTVDRRTKSGKENVWIASMNGKAAISLSDMETAEQMVAKARADPAVAELLDGEHEKAIFWTDEDTGIKCKCRVDVLRSGEVEIVDYKTTRDASTRAFNNSIFRYGYDFQAGMYCEGVKQVLGLDRFPPFKIIAQETNPPYAINRISLPPEVVLAGYDTFRFLVGEYKGCVETGYWHGYNGPFDLENEAYLPGWMQLARPDDEEE